MRHGAVGLVQPGLGNDSVYMPSSDHRADSIKRAVLRCMSLSSNNGAVSIEQMLMSSENLLNAQRTLFFRICC